MTAPDVAVIGAGLIGTAIAWRCRQAGASVTLLDPSPGSGASTVAAGMLAPVTEAHFGEEPLLRLALESARRWPGFAAELGADLGHRAQGTLLVGMDPADRGELDRLTRYYGELGLSAQPLDARQCRQAEPLLSHRISRGVLAADDHQVDPRRVHAALMEAATGSGVKPVARQVTDPTTVEAGVVVVATGSWSGPLLDLPVRPVRGQVLRLKGPDRLRHTVRALIRGRSVYAVPRADGEVVIGATSDERGFDDSPNAGDTYTLLRHAIEVLPELAEYTLAEINVGFRPGTPDNAPILGATRNGRVIAATGHYRQGVLLTPVTADLISQLALTGRTPALLEPFDPSRFTTP